MKNVSPPKSKRLVQKRDRKASVHDHGNCELCDQIEKALAVAVNVLRIIASYNMEATAEEMNYHKEIAEQALAQIEALGK